MQQNHSPLPWECDVRVGCIAIYPASMPKEETQCLAGANSWAIHYKPGRQKVDSKQIEWEVDPEDEANAQFIVQACNAHGILLQACKDALYYLRQCEMDFSLPPSTKTMKDIFSEAIAAITKVEAKL